MESMITRNLVGGKELNRGAAFGAGSHAYLPAFDLFRGGAAAWPCTTGVFIAPNAVVVQGRSGFSGMIMNSVVEQLQQLPVPTTTVLAEKRHPETLAPYPWRPPA